MSHHTEDYTERIRAQLGNVLSTTEIPNVIDLVEKKKGKVRDSYITKDKVILVTSDRISAFDRHLASIPFKGQVLNGVSVWWFHMSNGIIPNHLLSSPDPNTSVCKKCTVFQVEFVVRGFITGTTETSMWTHYNRGVRDYCGIRLPEGLKKNQRLPEPLVTPTTKDDQHDELISAEQIIERGLMTKGEWEFVSERALRLFKFGQKVALEHGLLLVDTKYEFGKDENGNILLVDEIHTPDSSRYWFADTFEDRFAKGQNPDNIDKDIIRNWYREHCDPYKDEVLPAAPEELVIELSKRYIELYERITGEKFSFPQVGAKVNDQLVANLKASGICQ